MKTSICNLLGLCALSFGYNVIADPLISAFTVGDPEGDRMHVSVEVSSLGEGGNAIRLYVGEAAPREGDPKGRMSVVETREITSVGIYTFDVWVTLGTKVACKAEAVDGAGLTASSEVVEKELTDSFGYSYIGTGEGNWHDPANWQVSGNDAGYAHVGYPAYTMGWVNMGNGLKTVHVDAEYSVREFHINQGALQMTLIGDSDNAMVLATGDIYTGANTLTFDHIRVYGNSYTVPANGKLSLLNGADLNVKWEINVNGENAYLYIGPGSIAQTKRDWWWTFRIDGQNALVEIEDGTLYTRGLRFGENKGNVTPTGVILKGSSPLIKIDEELVVVNKLPGSPVIEFYVPYGGYAQPPIQKVGNDWQFPMCGYTWQGHGEVTSTDVPPVLFKISPRSPFFTQLDTADFLLVDWSWNHTSSVYINEPGVSFAAFEEPADNHFHYESTLGGTPKDQIWVAMKGTGIPFSRTTVESAVTAVSSGNDLSITATINEIADGTATATLYIGYAGPNGDPTANMTEFTSAEVTELGAITLNTSVPRGSQVAYAVECTNFQGARTYVSSTVTNVFRTLDNATYVWKGGEGLWSDPDKWDCQATDGVWRMGYPSYGSMFKVHGTPDNTIYVDGAYTGLQGNGCFGWKNVTTRVIGITPDAEVSPDSLECYDRVNLTLDGVKVQNIGSYVIGVDGSLKLYNGASLTTGWEFRVNGRDALLHISTNCFVQTTIREPYHRFEVSGEGARVEIDDGRLDILYMVIGYSGSKLTETPAGFFFSGKNPQLTIRASMGYAQGIVNPIPGSPVFHFSIPVDGYTSTPVRRTGICGGNVVNLFDTMDTTLHPLESVPPVKVQIDPKSPFFNESRSIEQPLIDWSYDTKGQIVTSNVVLEQTVDPMFCTYYYTRDGEMKTTGLSVHASGRGFTLLILR